METVGKTADAASTDTRQLAKPKVAGTNIVIAFIGRRKIGEEEDILVIILSFNAIKCENCTRLKKFAV